MGTKLAPIHQGSGAAEENFPQLLELGCQFLNPIVQGYLHLLIPIETLIDEFCVGHFVVKEILNEIDVITGFALFIQNSKTFLNNELINLFSELFKSFTPGVDLIHNFQFLNDDVFTVIL